MKTIVLGLTTLLLLFGGVPKVNDQKIIFDVTSSDTKVHQAVMLQMKVMSTDYPNTHLEVMVYGNALPMLMKEKSTVAQEVELYKQNKQVVFTACEVSMKLLFQIDEKQLLEGVGTVENAIPDIVSKQNNGWGYIKVVN